MTSDMRLKDAVLEHLAFDPTVDDRHVTVIADHGVVTLAGFVENYPAKLAPLKRRLGASTAFAA